MVSRAEYVRGCNQRAAERKRILKEYAKVGLKFIQHHRPNTLHPLAGEDELCEIVEVTKPHGYIVTKSYYTPRQAQAEMEFAQMMKQTVIGMGMKDDGSFDKDVADSTTLHTRLFFAGYIQSGEWTLVEEPHASSG